MQDTQKGSLRKMFDCELCDLEVDIFKDSHVDSKVSDSYYHLSCYVEKITDRMYRGLKDILRLEDKQREKVSREREVNRLLS